MVFVTFEKKQSARTGNILFQYLISKVISIEFGHKYIPIEEFTKNCLEEDTRILKNSSTSVGEVESKDFVGEAETNHSNRQLFFIVNENNIDDVLNNIIDIREQNIICDGFFQKDSLYIPRRDILLDNLYNSNDYWFGCYGEKQNIRDFLYSTHSCHINNKDVVISLRLDDFIQLPCPTSDILPPEYYLNILETLDFNSLFIVCDTIRHDWEHKYIEFFNKWNPQLIQEDLIHDCALMRECPILIHSNSTLCWIMSFLSKKKIQRYIPRTNFYGGQSLNNIEENDVLQIINPLKHQEVYKLNIQSYLLNNIYPLSYCIPDESFVSIESISKKKTIEIAPLIPGDKSTYKYEADNEDEYNQMYQSSLFAHTSKKGGWDCLRHYEIIANGCIPIFNDLDNCPTQTLTTIPKEIIKEAKQFLLPWNYNNKPLYDEYLRQIYNHCISYCSTSYTVEYFFSKMSNLKSKTRNVLLIRGNCGVNYTRETFWIGMKRYIQSIGGVSTEYPKIDYLYNNYQGEKKHLYGNGFTYAYRLNDDYNFTSEEIIEKINQKFFDLIIYGKVGPDELHEGSHPNMPLWDHVFKKYNKNQIVFLYGGDECIDLTYNNRYKQHIMFHSQFAHCFVRELRL